MINRSYIIGVMIAIILTGCKSMYGAQNSEPESGWLWKTVSPESQGFRSVELQRMVEHINSSNLAIHSVIIYRNGTIPFETYFEPYATDISHNLKSTSKGVISALIGIALHEGFIGSLDDSVLSYLPDFEVNDIRKTDITIRDLLTMSSGLQWDENDLNSMYTFFVSKRITGRVLKQPLVDEPGSRFNYNTGLTHLLSAIISEASGMSTLQFAEKYLFEPLDIRNVQWETDRDGYHVGGSELFLTPRAMTKFGVLYLQEGEYAGRQLIPKDWIRESTKIQIEGSLHGTPVQYGYLWWLGIDNPSFTYLDNETAFLAMGVHGQRIFISPELDAVIVITADEHDESQSDHLIRDFILTAIAADDTR